MNLKMPLGGGGGGVWKQNWTLYFVTLLLLYVYFVVWKQNWILYFVTLLLLHLYFVTLPLLH